AEKLAIARTLRDERKDKRGASFSRRAPRGKSLPGQRRGCTRLDWGGLAARCTDDRADPRESGLGVGAQGADGGNTHYDDERQHNRVLDSRRAVLTPQEIHCELP